MLVDKTRGVANVMFNHIRRENYPVSGVGRELAHHKIFGEIMLESLETPNRVQYMAPRSNRGAYREVHAFKHSRHQRASPEICVHSGCFQTGP